MRHYVVYLSGKLLGGYYFETIEGVAEIKYTLVHDFGMPSTIEVFRHV